MERKLKPKWRHLATKGQISTERGTSLLLPHVCYKPQGMRPGLESWLALEMHMHIQISVSPVGKSLRSLKVVGLKTILKVTG